MNDRVITLLACLAALALGVAAAVPFIAFDGRLIRNPDLLIDNVKLYYDAFGGWHWTDLPPPRSFPYFQGQDMIYGLATHLYQALRGLFATAVPFQQAAPVTIDIVNGTMAALATVVFFTTVRRLAGHVGIALLITALFAFAPQILDIGMERIDHFMLLPLIVLLDVSIAITRLEARPRQGAALGAALALISATKVTGCLFAVFPVSAMLVILALNKGDRRVRVHVRPLAVAAAATGLPLLGVLMIRYLENAHTFLRVVGGGLGMVAKWASILPFTPVFYYNVDLFRGYGALFLVLVAVAAMAVSGEATLRREPTAIWLIANLVLFSCLGVLSFKYMRGGYHLVPLYLYTLAMAANLWLRRLQKMPSRSARVIGAASLAVALVIPVAIAVGGFGDSARIAAQRPQSILQAWSESRVWIVAHFKPGSQICIMKDSAWANPSLDDLGLRITDDPFLFPYTHPTAMAQFAAPNMDQLRAACDAIIFNDFHKAFYLSVFRSQGLADRAHEWQHFFEALRQAYPPRTFDAVAPLHGRADAAMRNGYRGQLEVSQVEIYDLRGAPVLEQAGRPSTVPAN